MDRTVNKRQFIADITAVRPSSTASVPRSAFAAKHPVQRQLKYVSDVVGVSSRGMPHTDYSRWGASMQQSVSNGSATTSSTTHQVAHSTTTHKVDHITLQKVNTPHFTSNKQAVLRGQNTQHRVAQAATIVDPKPKHMGSKKSLKRFKSKAAIINGIVVLAFVMSSLLGVMAYKYHLAVQRVEAQGAVSEEAVDDFVLDTNTDDVESVASLSEDVPKSVARTTGASRNSNAAPYTITIPKLKVSANIKSMGITKSGAVNVPSNIWQVGWYKTSATPKDNTGVVLLNGHVHGPTKPGIFANLKNLSAGDVITVGDTSGEKYSYKVVSKSIHKAGEDDTIIYQSASPDKQGLNLVTCDGKIIDGKYEDRLVVFAERI